MVRLSDGLKTYTFYGDKEHLMERYKRGFRVCLYSERHEVIRTIEGLYITSEEKTL